MGRQHDDWLQTRVCPEPHKAMFAPPDRLQPHRLKSLQLRFSLAPPIQW